MPVKNDITSDIIIDPHQWVTRYADYLYAYAISRLRDEEQAQDLVQETFLAALEKVAEFKGNSSEKTWLTAILKYKIIDIYRKQSSKIQIQPASQAPDDFFDPLTGHWNVEYEPQPFGIETADPLTDKELSRIIRLCMQKLPALWLSVFTMKHMDEETTTVICSSLKISPANFWVIIHRAKVHLRACLQKNWINT